MRQINYMKVDDLKFIATGAGEFTSVHTMQSVYRVPSGHLFFLLLEQEVERTKNVQKWNKLNKELVEVRSSRNPFKQTHRFLMPNSLKHFVMAVPVVRQWAAIHEDDNIIMEIPDDLHSQLEIDGIHPKKIAIADTDRVFDLRNVIFNRGIERVTPGIITYFAHLHLPFTQEFIVPTMKVRTKADKEYDLCVELGSFKNPEWNWGNQEQIDSVINELHSRYKIIIIGSHLPSNPEILVYKGSDRLKPLLESKACLTLGDLDYGYLSGAIGIDTVMALPVNRCVYQGNTFIAPIERSLLYLKSIRLLHSNPPKQAILSAVDQLIPKKEIAFEPEIDRKFRKKDKKNNDRFSFHDRQEEKIIKSDEIVDRSDIESNIE